jgi:hypothetical protein
MINNILLVQILQILQIEIINIIKIHISIYRFFNEFHNENV